MTTLLSSAVLLPLNYRFGYEKAKYAFYLMVGLVAALMGFGVSANEDGLARTFCRRAFRHWLCWALY